jgi:AraC-like DNA-binding protein
MALQALGFIEADAAHAPWWIGALATQNMGDQAMSFSVPAHALATFNLCVPAALGGQGGPLPQCFITGPQLSSRRYELAAAGVLITVFATADALPRLALGMSSDWANRVEPAPSELQCRAQSAKPLDVAAQWMHALVACRSASLPRLDAAARVSFAVLRAIHAHANLPLSERSAQRHLQAAWGASPKWLARLLRLCEATERWPQMEAEGAHLADLAAEIGFTDQAHMAKEFRALCGTAPSALKSMSGLAEEDLLWALRLGQNHLLRWLLSRAGSLP